MHQRFAPRTHRFTYRLSTWLLDIDELDELDQQLPGFGRNRRAPVSFCDRDYGRGDGTPARAFIEGLLAGQQRPHPARVELLCQVRLCGYVFNPLSVWFCYDPSGRLHTTVYEVRNTFGERHHYLVAHPPAEVQAPATRYQHQADKCFYVSPFMPMACTYRFELQRPLQHLYLAIHQSQDGAPLLDAVWHGRQQALTAASLRRVLIRLPLNSVKVIAAIHWEALRLWLRGLRLVPRQPAPAPGLSLGHSTTPTTLSAASAAQPLSGSADDYS
jgi:DUF1365 family protein